MNLTMFFIIMNSIVQLIVNLHIWQNLQLLPILYHRSLGHVCATALYQGIQRLVGIRPLQRQTRPLVLGSRFSDWDHIHPLLPHLE